MTDRVVGVGGLLCVKGVETTSTVQFMNPGTEAATRVLPEVLRANAVSRDDLPKLRTFKDSIEVVKDLLSLSNVWVGHHIVFDVERLAFEFTLAGEDFKSLVDNALILDTRSLSAMILRANSPQAVTLLSTAVSWELDVTPGGLAEDIRVVSRIFSKLLRFLPDDLGEMKEVQKMAYRYMRSISGVHAPVLH